MINQKIAVVCGSRQKFEEFIDSMSIVSRDTMLRVDRPDQLQGLTITGVIILEDPLENSQWGYLWNMAKVQMVKSIPKIFTQLSNQGDL